MNLLLDTHVVLDRMLLAQAKVEKLTLVTHDDQLEKYGIPILRA